MYLFYVFSLIPLLVGLVLWLKSDKVVWQEWLGASAAAFLVSIVFHIMATKGMTSDFETWSGRVTHVEYVPRWKEYYEEAIYKTEYYQTTESRSRFVGSGKNRRTEYYTVNVTKSRRVFDRWDPRTRWHNQYWSCRTDLGQSFFINESDYNRITQRFGRIESRIGSRTTGEHASRFIEGDENDYFGVNIKNWCEPVTDTRSFENRVKACPSVFSFIKVPTNISVFDYPTNSMFSSGRLIGTSIHHIDLLKFDQLNSELGRKKKINLILIGYSDKDSMIAEYQKAAWIGGKKNDLVMMYNLNKGETKPSWTRVFGWSESEICKRNLESILLTNPLNNDILKLIEKEIVSNYVIKDWSKFDYLTIEPRNVHYIWFFIILILTQSVLYVYFHFNEFSKYESNFKEKQNHRRYSVLSR